MASGTGARQKTTSSSKLAATPVNGQKDTAGGKPALTASKSEQELEASML